MTAIEMTQIDALSSPTLSGICSEVSRPNEKISLSRAAHVTSLDGVRGIAVLAILIAHTGGPGTEFGVLGVDLFFVLSGFLITTLLTREWEKSARISFPRFWARRALRLMPIYWLFLGVMTLLMVFGPEPLVAHHGWSPAWHIASMWMYFANYLPMGGFSPV